MHAPTDRIKPCLSFAFKLNSFISHKQTVSVCKIYSHITKFAILAGKLRTMTDTQSFVLEAVVFFFAIQHGGPGHAKVLQPLLCEKFYCHCWKK